jgi:hypothetical protein
MELSHNSFTFTYTASAKVEKKDLKKFKKDFSGKKMMYKKGESSK